MPQTSKVDFGEITHSGFEVLNKDQKKRQESCTQTLINSMNGFKFLTVELKVQRGNLVYQDITLL